MSSLTSSVVLDRKLSSFDPQTREVRMSVPFAFKMSAVLLINKMHEHKVSTSLDISSKARSSLVLTNWNAVFRWDTSAQSQ